MFANQPGMSVWSPSQPLRAHFYIVYISQWPTALFLVQLIKAVQLLKSQCNTAEYAFVSNNKMYFQLHTHLPSDKNKKGVTSHSTNTLFSFKCFHAKNWHFLFHLLPILFLKRVKARLAAFSSITHLSSQYWIV